MAVSATIEDNEAEFEEADAHATLALCDLLEEADTGRMTLTELARRLRELTVTAPEHIDARAHLGSVLRECEQLHEAAAEYERAFEIGSKALPTDFDGRIEWIRLDNRPFLRAAYGLALVRLKTGKRPEATRLMEQLLQWNPNDNQGVRLIIGSEYLRAGDRARAGKVLREHAAEYPPYRYELGLLHLQKQKWAEAATSLRCGFVDNPYIAEILCGNPDPIAASNLGGQQLARGGDCQGVRRRVRRTVAADRGRSRIPAVAAHASPRDGRASGRHRMPAGTALGERLQRQRTNPGPGTSGVQRHRVNAVRRDHQAPHGPKRPAHGALERPEGAGMAGRALESRPTGVLRRPTTPCFACPQHQQVDARGRRCIGYRQQPGPEPTPGSHAHPARPRTCRALRSATVLQQGFRSFPR